MFTVLPFGLSLFILTKVMYTNALSCKYFREGKG